MKTSENGSIITPLDYQQNIHSDITLCIEVIEETGLQEKTVALIANGAYGSKETEQLAQEKNIELVTTELIGKTPDEIMADFQINETAVTIAMFPAVHAPNDCKY